MKPGMRPSETAEGVAFARALASYEYDARLQCPDDMGRYLIGPLYRFYSLPGVRVFARRKYERELPGNYTYHIARTRHIDDIFSAQVASGVKQFVILGAGLDTRAYRFAKRLESARVFEVDHPATSAWKRKRLRSVLGALPSSVIYVPVDFERHTLGEQLASSGFDLSQKTFFLWEGVSMYLTITAIDSTFAFVTSAAPGSTLVFDYFNTDVFAHPSRYRGGVEVFERVKQLGEPYTYGMDPEGMDDFLAARGMRVLSHTRAEDFVRAYADVSGPQHRYSMLEFWGVVHGEVITPSIR